MNAVCEPVCTLRLPSAEESPSLRRHQGIPGVEVTPEGDIFVCLYSNREPAEGPGNYVIVTRSRDGGRTWSEELAVVPEPGMRAFDPVLWRGPDGVLRLFYAQSGSGGHWDCFDGRAGVWMSCCEKADSAGSVWSAPRRIADGVMMNKPTVLADGSWVLPVALWVIFPQKVRPEFAEISRSNLLVSRDGGKSFELLVGPEVPERSFDEHLLVERNDGSWWLLVRTTYGIGQSFSFDRGKSWSIPEPSPLGGPCSRFALRRLRSGRLCLVNHAMPLRLPGEAPERLRTDLCAWLSDDDGKSWYGRLLLDGRTEVAYPDFTEGGDGFLYIVHDHGRVRCHGQVLLSRVTEADVAAGELVTPGSCLALLADAFPFHP
ncbi:MAG: exo-alpha-sialidase [Lentisphaeria bacterium]|nr:exo-alpha-sialidase [Lentisphaeria bacterium]